MVDYVVAGGAERAAVEIVRRLGPGVVATLVSSRLTQDAHSDPRYGDTVRQLEGSGVRFLGLGRSATWRAWEWRPLVRHLRGERVDVLHTHSWGSNAWGPRLAAAGGVPVHVAHEQTPFARIGGVRAWGVQALVNRRVTGPHADAVIVPSAWARDALVRHERVPREKIVVIPNGPGGADAGTAPAEQDVRTELGIARDAPIAIVAAMLRPEKQQDVLLRAAAALADTHPTLQLLVAGGGPTRDPDGTGPELARLAARLDIADRVHLLGRRGDVARLVAAADVAVLSSAHENLPLAVVEYMEAGTPIVATAVGGVPELIEDGVHGLLVPPGDAQAMARAIATVLGDPVGARRRAAAARERRRAVFDWDAVAGRVRELYERLLAERKPRG
jgi:glycosyltransferase involved in cell wall biosynthesis